MHHYTKSVPSGKSWYYFYEGAIVVFSIPPNPNISRWLVGEPNKVLELSRLWAPDGHAKNLMSRAVSHAVKLLKKDAPGYEAVVSYADPNVGHNGGVYKACSWVFCGQSEEGRYYRLPGDGNPPVSRRKFHSGKRSLKKAEIISLGYEEVKRPGKLRFAFGLTKKAKRRILMKKRDGG